MPKPNPNLTEMKPENPAHQVECAVKESNPFEHGSFPIYRPEDGSVLFISKSVNMEFIKRI